MNAISRSSLSLTPTQPQECCVVKLTERSVDIAKDGEAEDAQAQRLLYCSLCKVVVNSRSQLEAHNKGEEGPDVTLILGLKAELHLKYSIKL